jgi:hypothetical protein
MQSDDVEWCRRWAHFFQLGLHKNKAPKSPYYASGPCCPDVCVKRLWPKELSFLLSYSWLEWIVITIWGWCIASCDTALLVL